MKEWLREPLLHFALLALLIFAGASFVKPDEPKERVVINVAQVVERYVRQTGASPDESTRAALVEQAIERELLFRQAQALGLGDGDEIVRRRLIQKMTLVLDQAVRPAEPDDDTLTKFLRADPKRFERAARRTLTHVFFRKAAADAERQANAALAALGDGGDPKKMGAPFLHGFRLGPVTERKLAQMVDPAFAKMVFASDRKTWFGPVRSSYGLHLVRIESREPGRLPPLKEIRRSVSLAWRAHETEQRRARAIALLHDRYAIEIRDAP